MSVATVLGVLALVLLCPSPTDERRAIEVAAHMGGLS